MDINLKTENFISQLYELINSSELPVVNVYLALNMVYENVKRIYNEQIQKQMYIKQKEMIKDQEQKSEE